MSPRAASQTPLLSFFFSCVAPALATLGCSSGGSPPASGGVTGSVLVVLDSKPPAHATMIGNIWDGPTNELVVWEQVGKDGGCVLLRPRIPFCSTRCDTGLDCVEDDTCKAPPAGKDLGMFTIKGVMTAAGDSEVVLMSNKPGLYQSATSLAYPPFEEGADVSLEATGGADGAFSVHAKAITPLVVPEADIPVEKDKPMTLTWTAKGAAGASTIHVHVDISHHGGTKGKIECDVPDSGSLTVGAPLMTQLVNLGVSGYPTVLISRRAAGSTKVGSGSVALDLDHGVERAIVVPGHTSCNDDTQCPTGQTCQTDLQCG